MKMNSEEEKLLREICEKHEVNPKYLEILIKLEKEYANKNIGRRIGLFKEIREMIEYWTMY